MISDGLQIMLIGMSVVFFLLAFIVASVAVSSRVIRIFKLHMPEESPAPPSGAAVEKGGHIAAAVIAAVARFRGERK